jgi:hypothetical protein
MCACPYSLLPARISMWQNLWRTAAISLSKLQQVCTSRHATPPPALFQPKGCSTVLQLPLQLPYQLPYNCFTHLIQLPSRVQGDDHPRHKEHRTSIVACTKSDTHRTAASSLPVLGCCLFCPAPGDKLATCMFRQCAPAAFCPEAACTHEELYAHNCGDGIPLLESGTAHHGVHATALRGRCRHHCWGHPQGHHGERHVQDTSPTREVSIFLLQTLVEADRAQQVLLHPLC